MAACVEEISLGGRNSFFFLPSSHGWLFLPERKWPALDAQAGADLTRQWRLAGRSRATALAGAGAAGALAMRREPTGAPAMAVRRLEQGARGAGLDHEPHWPGEEIARRERGVRRGARPWQAASAFSTARARAWRMEGAGAARLHDRRPGELTIEGAMQPWRRTVRGRGMLRRLQRRNGGGNSPEMKFTGGVIGVETALNFGEELTVLLLGSSSSEGPKNVTNMFFSIT
jgi:hypothetical protein